MKTEIENQKKILVIDYFLNNRNNSVKEIAAALQITEITVQKIVNKYLNENIPNGRN